MNVPEVARPTNEPQYWLPEWPRLEWELPIADIRPAEYNPRFLSDEAFDRLKASIASHGVIKPIIVNGDGIILAGHQRTKAMTALGMTTTPALVLTKDASADDEVQFNLTHNSVEESKVVVTIPPRDTPGYHWVAARDITVVDKGKAAARVGKAAKLVTRHGPWGSVVADPAGRVIANAEYAMTLASLRMPLLVHYQSAGDAAAVEETLAGDFGIYDPGKAALTPYVQTMLQRFRLRNIGEEHDWRDRTQGSFRSTTWERLVLPWLTREHTVVDFGAGRMDYTRHLQGDGYDVLPYEPFFINVDEDTRKQEGEGRRAFDLAAIARMQFALERRIRTKGLFDVAVLDSVINATSTEAYQDWIFNTVAALLADDGRLCMGTLSTRDLEARNNMSKARSVRATVSYVGKDNRAVAYAHGVLYAVKYHSPDTLREALHPYFASVEIEGTGNQLRATCTGRRLPADPQRTFRALVEEFDMLYPGGLRHGAHRDLVTTVMTRHWPDWTPPEQWPAGGLNS